MGLGGSRMLFDIEGEGFRAVSGKGPPNGLGLAFLLPNQNSVDQPAGGLV